MTDEKLDEYNKIFAERNAYFDKCCQLIDEWFDKINEYRENGQMSREEWNCEVEKIKVWINKLKDNQTNAKSILERIKKVHNI